MTIASGNCSIGPSDGKVTVNTYRSGLGAAVGHDLVLQADEWSGTVDVRPDDPSASSVSVTVVAGSLQVVEGSGGAKPLSNKDRADIRKNINDKVLNTSKHRDITFQSSAVEGALPNLSVNGTLTIMGNSRPANMATHVQDDGTVTGEVTIVQSEFGIKPFSAMLGALKVRDAVELKVTVKLPTS